MGKRGVGSGSIRCSKLTDMMSPRIAAGELHRGPTREDAVAEVFLVAWRKIDVVPPGEAARGVVVRHRPQGHRQHETIAASPGCLGGSHLPGAPCR